LFVEYKNLIVIDNINITNHQKIIIFIKLGLILLPLILIFLPINFKDFLMNEKRHHH